MEYLSKKAKPFFKTGTKSNDAFLLIHGFTGSPAHMYPLGEELNQAGYNVAGILLPGHGTSLSDMEETTGQDWLDHSVAKYQELKAEYDKVYVLGLSMGGTLSLILGERFNPEALISIAAPIKLQNKLAYFAPVLKYFKRYDRWPDDKDKDPYDVGYEGVPVKSIPELLKLIKESRKNLAKITSPTLVIQPENDETVKPKSAEIIYQGLTAVRKDLLWLKNSGHVCTIGLETDIIVDKVLDFIKK